MNERHTYKARGVTKPLCACIARAVLLLLLGLAVDQGDSRAQILPSLGGDRAGTSGFQFLKIPIDPRGAALGEAVVATASDASAMFWNPAMSAQTDGLQVGIHHASYFVDVNMDFVAISYHLRGPALTIGALSPKWRWASSRPRAQPLPGGTTPKAS